jgi:hypothetical protein
LGSNNNKVFEKKFKRIKEFDKKREEINDLTPKLKTLKIIKLKVVA